MSVPPSSSIRPTEVRTCDEHRCILLRNSDVWERFNRGALILKHPCTKRRKDPKPDRKGRVAPWNQNISLIDPWYTPDDPRYIVLEAHCFRLANGEVGGASGLVDPKEVLVGDKLHVRLAYDEPHCVLCESGDMIPLEARFHDSRYRPSTPPLPWLRVLWIKVEKQLNVWRDRWVQRTFRRTTMPPRE